MRFARRDWLVAGGLFVVAFALRLPFRSEYAYHWDSAQFALAVNEYNVALSQPHAPGYFLYVMLGRAVNRLVGDPHASLVWLSVVFGSALAGAVYLLGRAMFGRAAGVVGGVFALTSPLAWFHSCVALTYVVDAFLVCVMVLWCWRAAQRGGRWVDAVVIGALLALIGGVRPQTVPGVLPAVAYMLWRFGQARAGKVAVAAVVGLGLTALWLVPTVKMSGGLSLYLEIVRRHVAFNAPATWAGGGWAALWDNVAMVVVGCWNGVGLAAVVLLAEPIRRAIWKPQSQQPVGGPQCSLMAAWVVPMVLLGTVVGFTKQPGYVLSYVPALLVLAGAAVSGLPKRSLVLGVTVVGSALNTAAFLSWPVSWQRIYPRFARSAAEIREHDGRLGRLIGLIRARFKPEDAVLCFAHEAYLCGIRHFQLHLPEFEQWQLAADPTVAAPEGRRLWRVRGGRLEFAGWSELGSRGLLLLVVAPSDTVEVFAQYFDVSLARAVDGAEGGLYVLSLCREGGASVQKLDSRLRTCSKK